jgi:hypothetical protein
MIYFDALTIGGLIAVASVGLFLIRTCITQGCSRCSFE